MHVHHPNPTHKRYPKSRPRSGIIITLWGLIGLTWLLLRSGSKPTRLSYPCQQSALGLAATAFGGPIGVMLYEHQVARGLTREMAGALTDPRTGDPAARTRFCKAARQYADLLTNHIFKEDTVLFEMGDHMMNPDDRRTLATQFCTVNCRVFEGRRREQLEQIADELEAECGHG